MNGVTPGTAVNQRLGVSIKMHRVVIRGYWHFFQSNVPGLLQTADLPPPSVRCWVQNDKVPSVPGTVQSVIAADSDPPGATDTALSNLANTLSTDRLCIWQVVPNPLSEGIVELLADRKYPHFHGGDIVQTSLQAPYVVGSLSQIQGATYTFEIDIPLHGRVTDYSTGSSSPITNQLTFNFRPSLFSAAIAGSYMQYRYTTELHFTDVTDQ